MNQIHHDRAEYAERILAMKDRLHEMQENLEGKDFMSAETIQRWLRYIEDGE